MLDGVDDNALTRALRAAVRGRVAADAGTRALYATDASNYRVPPRAVVLPRCVEDVAAVIGVCREFRVPLTARGAGTSIAGNAIGPGVILDFSRYLDTVIDLDPVTRLARVQPGVVLDSLQAAAARHGLRFGPDPSSHSRCTLGGMIGNNACGSHSVAWGTTAQSVEELVVLMPDGSRLVAGAGPLPAAVADLVRENRELIRAELPYWPRRGSGYALQHLLPEHGSQLARALVGTEGTCAVVVEATVRLVVPPPAVVLLVLGFPDLAAAADAAPGLLGHDPLTVEGLDVALLDALGARRRPELPAGAAWLLVEFGADARDAAVASARAAALDVGGPHLVVTDPVHRAALWRVREAGAGLATRLADGTQAWPGWEDATVPPSRLGDYLRGFADLLAEHGRHGAVYGHFGEGCVHVRLDADLASAAGRRDFLRLLEQAADLTISHGGSLCGEHGDGRARGELLSQMYSPAVLRLFAQFKAIFDPDRLLNPGVLVDPRPLDADLRPGRERPVPVSLALRNDGGSLVAATQRCVGVGACRQLGGAGVMCPSFQVTRQEKHSTRGRAHLLAEMLAGDLVTGGWRSAEVDEALDLCLACKACASDCPVNVDMATYKAEFLHQRYRWRLRPRWHYALGGLPLAARFAVRAPRVANTVAPFLARLGGVSTARPLPRFARYRPPQVRGLGGSGSRGVVLLWPDCFTRSFDPHVLHAAARVLAAAGFAVRLPAGAVCCGLTWFTTGQFGIARLVLRRSLRVLRAALAARIPVVGLEPSCVAMLRSDLPELLPANAAAAALAQRVCTLAEVLREQAADWQPPDRAGDAVQQVHCHQHAVLGHDADDTLLGLAGIRVRRVSGCCGLAGNFGYQRGHEELSAALAERSLVPAIQAMPGALVLADGFSCRQQIAQTTGRRAWHLAEVLDREMVDGDR
jgi:FAD/FMN-containing dehydrogenase/Fe-S oxidoreductase